MGSGHKIVSCFIFDQDGNLLLLKRHRDDWGGGLWATPAGSIEPGEPLEAALKREVQEETGLAVGPAEYLGAHRITIQDALVHMHSYKVTVARPDSIVLDADEHEDYRWLPLSALLEEPDIIWATPSILRDFGLLPHFDIDPTLADGTSVERVD